MDLKHDWPRISHTEDPLITRRNFLKLGMAATLGAIFPLTASGSETPGPSWKYIRKLNCKNAFTKEHIEVIYWADGYYLPPALAQINYLFRDHLSGRVKPIDTTLLDLLFALSHTLHNPEPIHLLSGYRSARSNARLRQKNKNAARNSYHLYGQAADIRLPGSRLSDLRRVAKYYEIGGVGYYPRRNFIHIDVGPVRYWRG